MLTTPVLVIFIICVRKETVWPLIQNCRVLQLLLLDIVTPTTGSTTITVQHITLTLSLFAVEGCGWFESMFVPTLAASSQIAVRSSQIAVLFSSSSSGSFRWFCGG